MAADYEWFSATRITGLTADAAALFMCGARWRVCRRSDKARRVFAWLAGVQLFLLLDMAFDWRWDLHGLVMRGAAALGVYGERRLPQAIVLVMLCFIFGRLMASIWRRCGRRTGVAVAMTGTLLSVGTWFCELISFHYTDAVLLHKIGSVLVVALLWIGFAAVTCCGVWIDGRSRVL